MTLLPDPDGLYALLPAFYREQDADQGYPLRALLRLVAEQAALVESDIGALYDNLFIETCQPWVIPYIGDLVSNNLLYDATRLTGPDTAASLFPDLTGRDLRPPIAARARADVAKTIYYRRRKGTLPMLEELARDVTGWPAHAVAFFERLGWHQHREHLRLSNVWTDVRVVERIDRINGPFEEASHTPDVRAIASEEGWYNIRNIGFFVWRLRSYPLERVPARRQPVPAPDWQYRVSPLGNDAPLFTRWRREGDEAGLATELHVGGPLRRAFFYTDLERYRALPVPPPRPDFSDLYGQFDPIPGSPLTPGPECSLFLIRNNVPVALSQNPAAPDAAFQPQIQCGRLDPWPVAQPVGKVIVVDVTAGRLAVGDGWGDATTALDAFYHYGFSADLGGGPYERRKWLIAAAPEVTRLYVQEDAVSPPPGTFVSLTAALTAWQTAQRPNTVITILDSRTYALPATILLRNEGWLAIEAANGERPLLQTRPAGLEIQVSPPAIVGDRERNAVLTLNGVIVEGHLHVTGEPGRLRLLHATLIPGRRLIGGGFPLTNGANSASLIVEGGTPAAPLNAKFRLEIAFSIVGPLVVPEHADGIWLLDSIVDGIGPANNRFGVPAISGAAGALTPPGPPLAAERVTILGQTGVKQLDASETIFAGQATVQRTQAGCVRFSFVPPGSVTPRRYECQPERAVQAEIASRQPTPSPAEQQAIRDFIEGWLLPAFTATQYGQPAYAQLRVSSPLEIRTGAEDGSEMGAFCHLKQPQREDNLRIRLEEYLPFGLEAGIIYVT